MRVCVCVCARACVYTCLLCVYTHVCMYVSVCVRTHVYIHPIDSVSLEKHHMNPWLFVWLKPQLSFSITIRNT